MNAEEKKIEIREEDNWDHCCSRCFFIILILFIIVFHQWIIAEITTPIRCKILGDKAVQFYLTPEEWKKLRGIETLYPLLSVEEYNKSYREMVKYYSELDKEGQNKYPLKMNFDGYNYTLQWVNIKTDIIRYKAETEFYNLVSSYTIYYDIVLNRVIGKSIDLSAYYFAPTDAGVYGFLDCYKLDKTGDKERNSSKLDIYDIYRYYNF
ncbi:hypothetical protein [Gallibacterium anatis]|uniref:hypothetical protein n=1 Tax=Gallibacterium anatis TaxID=750 RepID=UPI0039FDDD6C